MAATDGALVEWAGAGKILDCTPVRLRFKRRSLLNFAKGRIDVKFKLVLQAGVVMKSTVLIADDDGRIREVVRLYLEAEGFEVYQAKDGQQALDLVRKTKIDMAVLDLTMPALDGHCRREIR
jgi:PleD family two-component response regulator